MGQPLKPRLPPSLLEELRDLPWQWRLGQKHWQLRIGGDLVAIWPKQKVVSQKTRNDMSIRAHIRRWRKQHGY